MSTGPGTSQGKTPFVEQFLSSNRDANLGAVNDAWRSAGNEGTVSESLVSKIRSRLKATSKEGANGGPTEDVPAAEAKAEPTSKGSKRKGATKAESVEAPASPENRGAKTSPARSAFVLEVLGREPGANARATNRAWSEAGHEGTISDSIFFKVKRELGSAVEPLAPPEENAGAADPKSFPVVGEAAIAETASKTPARKPKSKRAASPATVAASDAVVEPPTPETTPTKSKQAGGHGRDLHEIEGEIDELMFRLKGLGGYAEVQDALRTARRLLVRSHGE